MKGFLNTTSCLWQRGKHAFSELFFPRLCPVCNKPFPDHTGALCLSCLHHLPRTNHIHAPDNPLARLFEGMLLIHPMLRFERASSYFFYVPHTPYANLILDFKFHSQRHLAAELARTMIREYGSQNSFFDGLDYLVPIPIHPKRAMMRGYNQSHYIAKGIHDMLDVPIIEKGLHCIRHTRPQANTPRAQRYENMDNVFRWDADLVARLAGKRILLIDDVITTGSTISACARALLQTVDALPVESRLPIRLSILSLAYANR